ncbi:monocarboxylate transporter 12 [Aplysia californica]|uniref:Monocarboxylate transporter 12 n=1 Tax=Aplysia californica TaxID=6500 RepID=A0ABM0JLF7_APLCA|nr:monocarboxylate transporter 12 [Aplysia californica]
MGTPATRPKPPVPVDSGWAWFVMFGAFLNQVALVMFARAQALLFIEFLRVYEASATATTLAFGMVPAWFAVANISVSSFFMKRFKYRTLALFGSVVHSLSITSIAFCPNIGLLGVFFALIGAAQAFIVLPQTALLGHYFKRRISFANAVASMGISLATLVGTPLCRFLLDEYALRGTLLVFAAFSMNAFVASLLFRPISGYDLTTTSVVVIDEEGIETTDNDLLSNSKSRVSTDMDHLTTLDDTSEEMTTGRGIISNDHREHASRTDVQLNNKGSLKDLPQRTVGISGALSKSLNTLLSSRNLKYMSTPNLTVSTPQLSEPLLHTNHHMRTVSRRSASTDINHVDISDEERQGSLRSRRNLYVSCFQKVKSAVLNSILTNPIAVVLIIAGGIGHHTQTSLTYIPAVGQENGLTDYQVSLLLTVTGVSDLVGKFSLGLVADTKRIPRVYIVATTQLTAAVLLQVIRFFQGFGLMLAHQVMFGYTLDVMQTFMPVLVGDFLGVHYIPSVLSIYFLLMGGVHTTDHLMMGIFKDKYDSFYPGFHYMGGLILLSTTFFLLLPFLSRCTKRYQKTETTV